MKNITFLAILLLIVSCGSTKKTIENQQTEKVVVQTETKAEAPRGVTSPPPPPPVEVETEVEVEVKKPVINEEETKIKVEKIKTLTESSVDAPKLNYDAIHTT